MLESHFQTKYKCSGDNILTGSKIVEKLLLTKNMFLRHINKVDLIAVGVNLFFPTSFLLLLLF